MKCNFPVCLRIFITNIRKNLGKILNQIYTAPCMTKKDISNKLILVKRENNLKSKNSENSICKIYSTPKAVCTEKKNV